MKKLLNSAFILLFTTVIAGCGFHLRGHEPLPVQLHTMYLESNQPYSSLTKQLQQTLQSVGVTLTQTAQAAPVTLQLLQDNFTQTTTAIGSGLQTSTYLLNYSISYQLLDNKGRVLQAPQTINTTRNYSITSNQILGDTNVQANLKDEMQRDVIYQLFNHLRSRNTLKALGQAE